MEPSAPSFVHCREILDGIGGGGYDSNSVGLLLSGERPWANDTVSYMDTHTMRTRWLQKQQAKAERLVAEELKRLEWAEDDLARRRHIDKFSDRYNWDGGKSVTIAGITITDEFMGLFHLEGLARECDMVGSVKRTVEWKKGEVPVVRDGWDSEKGHR